MSDEEATEVGLGRFSRAFADPRERARTAVQKAIRGAIDRIGVAAPELGQALEACVHTGLACRFDPVDPLPTEWVVTTP